MKKIGYFIPEFPGQTHPFLWREYNALLELGISAELVSTRRPPPAIKSHSWAKAAEDDTEYLWPMTARDWIRGARTLLSSGPRTLVKVFRMIASTDDLGVMGKARLLAIAFVSTKLANLAAQRSWDHIHCTTCSTTADLALFASMLGNITYSVSLLGPRLETYGPNQRNKWHCAAFGLCQSLKLLAEVKQKLAGHLPQHLEFAPVGVDVDKMKRNDAYVPWDGAGQCRLYSCGRLNPVKGHAYVLGAVEKLAARGIEVTLAIAGEDETGGKGYRQVIQRLIDEKRLGERVTLLGAVSEEQNRQQYASAHVYVMGSLDEAAGAVAAMEAMAMQVPTVMTNVGATAELIDSGQDGLLVEPKDPEQLANAIESVLRDPEAARSLSNRARDKIVSKFNHRISAECICRFLALI